MACMRRSATGKLYSARVCTGRRESVQLGRYALRLAGVLRGGDTAPRLTSDTSCVARFHSLNTAPWWAFGYCTPWPYPLSYPLALPLGPTPWPYPLTLPLGPIPWPYHLALPLGPWPYPLTSQEVGPRGRGQEVGPRGRGQGVGAKG